MRLVSHGAENPFFILPVFRALFSDNLVGLATLFSFMRLIQALDPRRFLIVAPLLHSLFQSNGNSGIADALKQICVTPVGVHYCVKA